MRITVKMNNAERKKKKIRSRNIKERVLTFNIYFTYKRMHSQLAQYSS